MTYYWTVFQLHKDIDQRCLVGWNHVAYSYANKNTLDYLNRNYPTWEYINVYEQKTKAHVKRIYRYKQIIHKR